jgi:hypothetical protein
MNFKRVATVVLGLLLICITVLVASYYLSGFGAAVRDNRSTFLKSFSVQQVSDRFGAPFTSDSTSVIPSQGFVTNIREIDPCFMLPEEKIEPLMTELKANISTQLLQNGAEIISNSGDADQGFHLTYRLGRTLGSASIIFTDATGKGECPPNLHLQDLVADRTVLAQISIRERWFPNDSPSISANSQFP